MNKSIVIIGAGASGVAAASKLLSKGFENVTILEAEKRFGGRVNTVPFGANVVDMGAQWYYHNFSILEHFFFLLNYYILSIAMSLFFVI